MERRRALVMLSASAIFGVRILNAQPGDTEEQSKDHIAWVSDVLREMLTIKPGMARSNLLSVFTTEGGISSRTWRTYVSRRCPLFKVDVTFEAVGGPNADDLSSPAFEGNNDIIHTISRPYLQFEIRD